MGPCVVSAVKSGAVSFIRSDIRYVLLRTTVYPLRRKIGPYDRYFLYPGAEAARGVTSFPVPGLFSYDECNCMDDSNAPATKADLSTLEERLNERHDMLCSEMQHMHDGVVERIADVETKLLQ